VKFTTPQLFQATISDVRRAGGIKKFLLPPQGSELTK